MKTITAPDRAPATGPTVFLAGGISQCPDWQTQAIDLLGTAPALQDAAYTVLNPRRPFPFDDPTDVDEQIEWEWRRLRGADIHAFWFPASSSPQPIALFELGSWLRATRLVVGVEPGYTRAADVDRQVSFTRPHLVVHNHIEAWASEVAGHVNEMLGARWYAKEMLHRV